MFKLNFKRDWANYSIQYNDNALWLYRKDWYSTVPLVLFEQTTLGM